MWWLIVLGLILIAVALYMMRTSPGKPLAERGEQLMPYKNGDQDLRRVPENWDEHEIRRVIQRNQNQPNVVVHYIESIERRFIDGQDIRTVRRRTRLLESWINALNVRQQYYSVLQSIKRLREQEEIKDLQVQIEKGNLQNTRHLQRKLQRLEERKIDFELAKIARGIEDLKHSSSSDPKLTLEQQRAKKRDDCKQEVDRLKQDQTEAMERAQTEEERVRMKNIYDDAISRAEEEWVKYL
jgi:hypothetical protein